MMMKINAQSKLLFNKFSLTNLIKPDCYILWNAFRKWLLFPETYVIIPKIEVWRKCLYLIEHH